ncbi:hypothetical protein LguiA_026098 [Lonicera macranthoides]
MVSSKMMNFKDVVNLALLLLENNIENTFYNSMVGTNGDKCNPATFCRADIGLDFCQLCTRNATLYFSVCMARYSDKEVYGTLDIRNAIVASECPEIAATSIPVICKDWDRQSATSIPVICKDWDRQSAVV